MIGRHIPAVLSTWLVLNAIFAVRADDAARIAFFEQKIRPVLVEHCYECHSAKSEKLKGGLQLDSQAGWQAGGDSGQAVIVPGKVDESLLMQYLRYADGLEMPPSGKLPDSVLADFEQWIASGAADPRTNVQFEAQRGDKTWWSLQPLRKHPAPGPADAVDGSKSIDEFIASKLAEHNLTRNPPTEARQLIRRMSYDVLGLPPTAQEVQDFAVAYAEDPQRATVKLADRLLQSPHYGEQWGRHWLDVVRFGESNGFERNVIIDDLWPFRDYVIRSINADKPFNRFIIEHLAGDVVGKDDPDIEIGSAFLVAGPYDDVGNQDVVAQANIRAATLDEIITITSGAFLGLTVNCARCHNHKFDPIPAEDYYRLRSAFEGVKHGRRTVATTAQKRNHADATQPLSAEKKRLTDLLEPIEKAVEQRLLEALKATRFPRPKIDPLLTEERFDPIAARHIRLAMHASTDKPNSAVGSRLVEVEVWTAGEEPRNVALAIHGAQAIGARSTIAEDFPNAYGPQFTIDGQTGEQWFIGQPAELTISLADVATIDRVTLSNAKGKSIQDKAQGATPCEYEILVSMDGERWQTVASSFDREPWSQAHAIERLRQQSLSGEETQQIQQLKSQIAKIDRQLKEIAPLPTMFVGLHSQPTEATRLHIGGDPMKPGEAIAPASLEVLRDAAPGFELPLDAQESDRRLELAKWITANENPLTARVLVNRVWQYHFGTGIVDTPSDFGFLGGQPTHPELLDWLATRLIENGWRLKHLHRDILLSQTYRQSAEAHSEGLAVDKHARLLWRFPPRRLAAEEIRDTMLFVSGQLRGVVTSATDSLADGPGFRLYKFTQNNVCTYFPLDSHGPETYRRAVYHQNARASVVDLLADFDLPDNAFAAPVRASTTTPLQALTLLNHQFTLDMAAALATRAAEGQSAPSPETIVNNVYAKVLQRDATAVERAAATRLIAEHGAAAFCRAVLNLNEVLYVE